MMPKRIILSSDENPKYIEFWPLVSWAWQKLFGIEVWLALVAPEGRFNLEGNIMRYEPVLGVPTCNQAKVARYHLAASLGDDTLVMTHDLDLLPLQRAYMLDLLWHRPPGHLLTVGSEVYVGPEAGKFTAGYLTLESNLWRQLVTPRKLEWKPFVRSFIGLRVFDHKEDISRTVHHENPDTFSDESLLRALLKLNPVPLVRLPFGYWPYTVRALDRADWRFDPRKLEDGTYVEAHLLRPLSQHQDRIQPLINYLKNV